MLKRCGFCGGTLTQRRVTAENWWGDDLSLVENVPAWVCEGCGEQYFEADTAQQLERLRESPSPMVRVVEVPVYLFR